MFFAAPAEGGKKRIKNKEGPPHISCFLLKTEPFGVKGRLLHCFNFPFCHESMLYNPDTEHTQYFNPGRSFPSTNSPNVNVSVFVCYLFQALLLLRFFFKKKVKLIICTVSVCNKSHFRCTLILFQHWMRGYKVTR